MKSEGRTLPISIVIDAREAVQAIQACRRRFRDALHDVPPRSVFWGLDWCAEYEPEIRARNLVTVRALPCERE